MRSLYHQLYFHFVWGTYKRQKMIDQSLEPILKRLVKDKIREKGADLLCFGCTEDHIHLLVRAIPSISVSDLIGEIKGYSSYVISNKIQSEPGFRWQGGYGVMTFSEKDLPWLIKYVRNQKEHHKIEDLQPQWEIRGI